MMFDLVDGSAPRSGQHGGGASIMYSMGAAGFEAWDAELYCARATVPGPVVLIAFEVLAEVFSAPLVLRPGHGFPPNPFHPPRTPMPGRRA